MEGDRDARRAVGRADEPDDYDRLCRFALSPPRQFGLAIARYSSAQVRDDTAGALQSDAAEAGVSLRIADAGPLDSRAHLLDWMLREASLRDSELGPVETATLAHCLVVIGLDSLLTGADGAVSVAPAIEELNRLRDTLPDALPVHVVLFLSEAADRAFAEWARDLNDVVMTRFAFDEADGLIAPFLHLHDNDAPATVGEQEARRLRRESALLTQIADDPSREPSRRAAARQRVGQISLTLGDEKQGLAALQGAAEEYERLGEREKALGSRSRAWKWLLMRELPSLNLLARRLERNRADADDLVQEVMTAIVAKPPLFAGPGARNYMAKALRHRFLDTVRKRRNWELIDEHVAGESPQLSIETADDHEPWWLALNSAQITEAAAELPEDLRVPFLAFHVEGRPGKDIAEELGVTLALLGVRLFKARRALREILARRFDPVPGAGG